MSTQDVKKDSHTPVIECALTHLRQFYTNHRELSQSESHGLYHAHAVHQHAVRAIESLREDGVPRSSSASDNVTNDGNMILSLSEKDANEIELAALLHDVDDYKYSSSTSVDDHNRDTPYPNALSILSAVLRECKEHQEIDVERIIYMIDLVSCSQNGNDVPMEIQKTSSNYEHHLLIPRWSDRLEAVGRRGVIRCYQYTLEKGRPLWGEGDPRPKSETEVWDHATPDRFKQYLTRGKCKHENKTRNTTVSSGVTSNEDTMIAHYYDKLLHIARPPPGLVRNVYLEQAGSNGSSELVHICVQFGLTGRVDEDYIRNLMSEQK